ncbi:prenylated flavin chaperone LpdD [Companilactobacillus zhachilii]|uniref:Amino acid decarboxylase n=1 Tax=Companilactobacillus zhachilii TaxID=2304606 RepID=A0A386PPW0_9LACO|nr:amino acid decarboxylase [Companilactobacillus zhachilii]AYE37821.1 amino acid decarboxylase [Companilactobacillus zhachilii]
MKFSVTQENYTMIADVEVIGKDLLIKITGGDTPHIGSVTTLTKETDLETIRYPSHDGRLHKDDVLAVRVGKIIQDYLPGSCTITAGVHVNHISKKQIMVSAMMSKNLGEQIRTWLEETDFSNSPKPIYYSDNEKPQ